LFDTMGSAMMTDPPSKAFEDFAVGDVMLTRGRTVDVGDITLFAGLTGDHYPLHTDATFAAGTPFGERIAHGPLTFALAVGLVGLSGLYGDAIVALVEVEGLRATKPVRAGDTLRVRAEVVGCETDDARPRYGTLRVRYGVLNQHDDEVMQFTQSMLARRRDPGGSHA
jgi:3-hydroxybutyryl-CoA dehydratase